MVSVWCYFQRDLPPYPQVFPDSFSYLEMNAIRPLAYPLYLRAVHALGGSWAALPDVQLASLMLGVAAVFYGLLRLTRRPWIAGGGALALASYGPLLATALTLLSEPLYIALLLVFVASACVVLASGSRAACAVAGASAALAMATRPVGYFLLLGLALLPLLGGAGWWRRLLWIAAAAGLTFGALGLTGWALRGTATQSIAGLALFPHIAHLHVATPGLPHEAAARELEARLAEYRARLDGARGVDRRCKVSRESFPVLQPLASRTVASARPDDIGGEASKARPPSISNANDLLRAYALAAIRAAPLGYLEHVALHVVCAWRNELVTRYTVTGRSLGTSYRYAEQWTDDFESRYGPDVERRPAAELIQTYSGLREKSRRFDGLNRLPGARALRPIALLASLAGVACLLVPRLRRRPVFAAWGLVSLLAHAAVWTTAALIPFTWRYAQPIDPLLLLGVWLAIAAGLEVFPAR